MDSNYFDENIPTSVLQDIMDYRAEGAAVVRSGPPTLAGLLHALNTINTSFYDAGHTVHAMMKGDLEALALKGENGIEELTEVQVGMGEGYMRAYVIIEAVLSEFVEYYKESNKGEEG